MLSQCCGAELTDANTYYKASSTTNWTVCSKCGAALNPDGTLPKEIDGG
jgi:hypothetical protein